MKWPRTNDVRSALGVGKIHRYWVVVLLLGLDPEREPAHAGLHTATCDMMGWDFEGSVLISTGSPGNAFTCFKIKFLAVLSVVGV